MNEAPRTQADLERRDKVRLLIDFFHRNAMHHALWFLEVRRQLGEEAGYEALHQAWDRALSLAVDRLARTLGFGLEDGLPEPLLSLPEETLDRLREKAAANWLATDGVWFQAVEFSHGMFDAKRCNDACWTQFSPFEAWSVRRFLGLPARPGLDGLKKALAFRLYASLNRQSFSEETRDSFVFMMNDCRVQSARKRKGLEDYPCKSGGMAEYPSFARAIDPRIQTECLGCPPDPHPEEWYCAWRFTLEED